MKRSLLAAVLGCGLLISGCGDDENGFFGTPFVEPFLLEFVNAPGFGQPNVVLAASEVQFQDANNQILPISNIPITVSLATNPTGATLSGTLVGDLINGSVVFNNLQLDRKGTFILRATSPGLNEALSTAITIGGGVPNFPALPNSEVAVGVNVLLMASGDFNGDGNLDLVGTNNNNANEILLLLGDGTGQFALQAPLAIGSAPNDIDVADLNGDGNLDLVATETDQDRLVVLLGNGNATFDAPVTQATGDRAQQLTIADFDGDGIPDVANTNTIVGNPANFTFNRGVGDGTFAPAVPFVLASGSAQSAGAICSGDFNGDGLLDVAVTDIVNNQVNLFAGNGSGGFAAPTSVASGAEFPRGIARGDFNSDGIDDVAVANRGPAADPANDSVRVLFGNISGTFTIGPDLTAGDRPNDPVVRDVNGDGRADILVTNSGTNDISIFLGNGDGTFGAAINQSSGGTAPVGLQLVDLNNDTLLDIAVGNNGTLEVSVFLQTQ